MEYLKSIAGPTVKFLGNLTDNELTLAYQEAKAFLFASIDEEFGIAPIEAMGHGLPVIAYSSGGLKETVHENINGFLFLEQTEQSLIEKINKLESLSENEYLQMREEARKESEKYTEKIFKINIMNFINSKLKTQKSNIHLKS